MLWYIYNLLLPLQILCRFPSDIDECTETEGICGLGSCTNNENGMFYDCDCPDGTVRTGANDALTCSGMLTHEPDSQMYIYQSMFNLLRYQ